MKKTALLLLLCICLLLAGCTAQTAPQPIQPEPEPVPTEPEPAPPAAETADTVASQEEQTQERPALPVPSASMFSLTGREAVLYDAAVAQRYPRSDNDMHYDFYYDYTGPGWSWNSGAMNTYLRAELETQDGAEVCTGFAIFPGGDPSDWISGECGPLAVQNADGAWVLPEPAGDWFPSDSSMLGEYLAAAEAMPEPAAVMPQAYFEAHMLALSDGKTAEELTIDTFPDVLAEDAALESFLRDTPEEAALCCATYLVENMWYGDGENEPYTTDLALTALGRLYVLSMQYLMETYNDSTSLLSALLLHTFSPEEWLYQFWGVVGGIAFAKEGFTLDSVYYDEHPIEKQCMTALLRSPKRLHVATLFDYVNPVDNERCDADHSALYDFLAEGKADDRLHIEPAGATREDLLAACTETAHWEVEGGTDTTILRITPEHGQELRLVYRFGEN